MQSTTIVPTSIGIIHRTPDMSTSDPSWEMSTSCRPPALPSGRLRLDVPMFVWIVPGHRTVAPTLEPSSSSSFASTSVSPRTPYFVSVYEPRPGMPTRPAMEEVLTMCPPSSLPLRIGRKAWMPWMTPHRFTPTIHFQSSSVRSAMRPIGPMPALLTSTCAVPNRSTTSVASAPTLSALDTSVWMPVAPSSLAVALQSAVLDVGDDELDALVLQRLGDALADARCPARDDGDLPFEIRERGHGFSSSVGSARW